MGACRNSFFSLFFTFFRKEGSFQIPDLARSDFYKANFLTFRPDLDWLASQPVQIWTQVQIFFMFCPDFLCIPLHSRE
jgi:hypothetical protein